VSHKQQLITAAILGTEQQGVPELLTASHLSERFVQLDGAVAELGRERSLLHAAAMFTLAEKAGRKLAKFNDEFEAPSLAERKPVVSPAAIGHLRTILEMQQDLLPEWLLIAAALGKRVPDDCLVPVLQIAEQNESLRILAADCVGARAHWLAHFNPAWSFAAGYHEAVPKDTDELQKDFDFGAIELRVQALREIRLIDAPLGLKLLRGSWKTDQAEDRSRFIAALESGLSMADEPFLEDEALNDRRKEVRQQARERLFNLPSSRLSARSKKRAFACLDSEPEGSAILNSVLPQVRRKVRLLINAPDSCDQAMLRDGIIPRPPDARMGEKAWWLAQIVEQVNPEILLRHLGMTGEQMLEAINTSSWQLALLEGFTGAVIRYKNAELAKLLLGQDQIVKADHLFAMLGSNDQEQVLSRLLENRGFLLIRPVQNYYDSEAVTMLLRMKHHWSSNFSKVILRVLRTHLTQKNSYIFMDYILRHIAKHLDVELWASIQESWASMANQDSPLSRMMSMLSMRKDMKDALLQ
jgi:hypothetical protein